MSRAVCSRIIEILELFVERQEAAPVAEKWLWDGKRRTMLSTTRMRTGSNQSQIDNTAAVREIRAFRRKSGLCVRCAARSETRECAKCNEKRRKADIVRRTKSVAA